MNSFDIVIPVGPNDIDILNDQVEYTKKNIIGYRNIYIIAFKDDLKIDDCIIISEKIFPFNMNDIINYIGDTKKKGWYLQQLIKLYAGSVIPNILQRYLVIDCDTFFLKPTKFINDQDKCLYNVGIEYHLPYFEHMKRLHPSLNRMYNEYSGICHHMMYEQKYLNEIFNLIENFHNDIFWKIFMKLVDKYYWNSEGASEYELYFNYILKYHPNDIEIRLLKWNNNEKYSMIKHNKYYDYCSYHWYKRQ